MCILKNIIFIIIEKKSKPSGKVSNGFLFAQNTLSCLSNKMDEYTEEFACIEIIV